MGKFIDINYYFCYIFDVEKLFDAEIKAVASFLGVMDRGTFGRDFVDSS